jgi:acyl-CoA reductase-like NAD-dependent aldehyde dehydrogenase
MVAPETSPHAAASPPATLLPDLDARVRRVAATKRSWPRVSLTDRIRLLKDCRRQLHRVSRRLVEESARAKGVAVGSPAAGEEWALVACNLKLLAELRMSLEQVARRGAPHLPGPVRCREDGQVVVPVFPRARVESLAAPGTRAEVWMMPDVRPEDVVARQAQRLRRPPEAARLCLVLGAGNASLLVPGDVLHALFVGNHVVVLKMHPVNAYLAPMLREVFAGLIEPGYLEIVEGNAAAGAFLCEHPEVDVLHMTGSDRTFEAIVFGRDGQSAARKARGEPHNPRPCTAELGNITPVLIVPGPWSDDDLRYQALQLASMHATNAAFNCLTPRLLVQHATWEGAPRLLEHLREAFAAIPTRPAYYPGAKERYERVLEVHPDAERFGDGAAEHLPWTLLPHLDPAREDEPFFEEESFCPVLAECELTAGSASEYLERAVELVNERVWGNLVVMLLVHPRSLEDPDLAAAVDRAIARLRYGSVCVNTWGAMTYYLATPTWGAFPGNPATDIQSGSGFVNNVLMLEGAQKTVVHAPFRMGKTPQLDLTRQNNWELLQSVANLEARPTPWNVVRLAAALLRATPRAAGKPRPPVRQAGPGEEEAMS